MIRTALIQRNTDLQVVQIVCMGIAWKKYVFTDSGARMRAMKVPCVIQSYSVLRELHDGDDEVSCKSLEQAQPTAYTRAFVFKLYKNLAVAETCSSAYISDFDTMLGCCSCHRRNRCHWHRRPADSPNQCGGKGVELGAGGKRLNQGWGEEG